MRMNRVSQSFIQSAVIEAVEARRMFAVTASLAGDVLTITGTQGPDSIVVSIVSGKLNVKLDATHTRQYNISNVVDIIANLGGGDDSFSSSNAVSVNEMSIRAGSGNDTITCGGATYAYIRGESGNDVLRGNSANNQITDGPGRDSCYGGNGMDEFIADTNPTEPDLYDGGSNYDSIYYNNGGRTAGVNLSLDNVANDGATGEHDNVKNNIEEVDGTNNNDIFSCSSLGYTESITGFGGNDLLLGSNFGEHFSGGEGKDSIYGYGGNDVITGGDGNDSILGGDGNDEIRGGGGNDFLRGGSGNDSIDGSDGNDSIYGDAGIDTMLGGDGDDRFYANDGNRAETVNGGIGNDSARVDGIINLLTGTIRSYDILNSIENRSL